MESVPFSGPTVSMTTSYSNYPPPVKRFGDGSTFDKAAYAAYEAVKSERDALKEAEGISKKIIEALEQETKDLLASYQGIYEENRVLRSKVEHGPDAQRIRNFRSEIKRLDDKVASLRAENGLLANQILTLQKDVRQVGDEKKRIDDAFKMERGLHVDKTTSLEKENKELSEKIEKLEKQKAEYEKRIKNYEGESDGLLNRYKELKRDNLKMETKFKKQKGLTEDELRETKETSKEMAKEIIGLKTSLAKVQSDYHSLKLDYEAAQKQIDYQDKELEVFKTQTSLMKRNVKLTSREYNSMKEELKSVEHMLVDAQNFGFEAVMEDRRYSKRKERKLLDRLDGLELQVEELTKENNQLEKEASERRKKMEAAVLEHQNSVFRENALKRRIELLENANLELDRQGKFTLGTNRKGVIVTMHDENIRNLEKEKAALFAKCRFLEIQNRRLLRRVKEIDPKEDIDDFGDDMRLVTYETRRRRSSEHIIHAEMPSLTDKDPKSSYRRKLRHVRSLPA